MTKTPPSPPKDQKTSREESLARALRDNLKRRKEQARARASHDPAGQHPANGDPAPAPVDKKD